MWAELELRRHLTFPPFVRLPPGPHSPLPTPYILPSLSARSSSDATLAHGRNRSTKGRAACSPAVAGFQPFPAKPGIVATDEQVNALRDAEGI